MTLDKTNGPTYRYTGAVNNCCSEIGRCGCSMSPLDLVRLPAFAEGSRGWLTLALINTPVVLDPPDLPPSTIPEIPGKNRNGLVARAGSVVCTHRTFVAGACAVNLSCALVQPSLRVKQARAGTQPRVGITVATAGNERKIGRSAITTNRGYPTAALPSIHAGPDDGDR